MPFTVEELEQRTVFPERVNKEKEHEEARALIRKALSADRLEFPLTVHIEPWHPCGTFRRCMVFSNALHEEVPPQCFTTYYYVQYERVDGDDVRFVIRRVEGWKVIGATIVLTQMVLLVVALIAWYYYK